MMQLDLLGLNNRLPNSEQLMFESVVGSHARGVASPTSDLDVVGVFVPYYEELYPNMVPGFGNAPSRFKNNHITDLSVHLDKYGQAMVDVLAMDVVHFFNMLVKPSPNHVEYLFFSDQFQNYSVAGRHLLQYRTMFLTQAFVTKCVALGMSVVRSTKEKTQKDYAFATRFFAYANHAVEFGTLYPSAVNELNLRMLSMDLDAAEQTANMFMGFAQDSEQRVTPLASEADLEQVNEVLKAVIKLHWAEQSIRGTYDA